MITKAIKELQKAHEREPDSSGPEITPDRHGQLREECNEAGQLKNQCLQPTKEECETFQRLWDKLLRDESLAINELGATGAEQREEKIIIAIAITACIIYAGSRGLRADVNDIYWWLRAWGTEKAIQCINNESEAINEIELAEYCKADEELWNKSVKSTKQESRQLCLVALTGKKLPTEFERGIKLPPGGIPKNNNN